MQVLAEILLQKESLRLGTASKISRSEGGTDLRDITNPHCLKLLSSMEIWND